MENGRAGPASPFAERRRAAGRRSRGPSVRVAAGPRAASAPRAGGSRWCARPDAASPASRCSRQTAGTWPTSRRRAAAVSLRAMRPTRRIASGTRRWPTGKPGTSAPTSGREPAATRGPPCEHPRRSAGVAIQRPPGGRAGAPRATRTVGFAFTTRRRRASATCRPPPRRPTFPSIPAARPWPVRPPPARARPALHRDTGRRRAAAPRPPRRGCARRRRSGRTPARRPDTSSRRR